LAQAARANVGPRTRRAARAVVSVSAASETAGARQQKNAGKKATRARTARKLCGRADLKEWVEDSKPWCTPVQAKKLLQRLDDMLHVVPKHGPGTKVDARRDEVAWLLEAANSAAPIEFYFLLASIASTSRGNPANGLASWRPAPSAWRCRAASASRSGRPGHRAKIGRAGAPLPRQSGRGTGKAGLAGVILRRRSFLRCRGTRAAGRGAHFTFGWSDLEFRSIGLPARP